MKVRIPNSGGPGNMNQMLKQAQKMQEDMATLQTDLEAREYTATSGGGAVTVTVDEPNEEGVTVYHLHVGENDMGRVIGKQGRIAKSIRTVMRAAATRNNEKIAVEIE